MSRGEKTSRKSEGARDPYATVKKTKTLVRVTNLGLQKRGKNEKRDF